MRRRDLLLTPAALAAPVNRAFRHRGYLGWITDLASEPDPAAEWPSMRLDEELLDDYRRTFDLMKALGFNEISIWGLYVSRAWPVEIPTAVTPARGVMVERLIDAAHARGIAVLSGLGVYSWGFDVIIRTNPRLSRGNPHAMCASEPAAWEWMRKVVDFVFNRFPIDGVSMQSADQGRCRCDQCGRYTDPEYHALLNVRTAAYVRDRWPKKTIGVNSWGMRFEDPASLPSLIRIGKAVDYLIDVHDTSRKRDPAYRAKLAATLACDFGTLGGPQVEPPQHWERDRWFLPTVKRTGQHLAALAADGGRACEYFFHILKNPGDEISLHVAGRTLRDPATGWQKHLAASVEEVFGVTKPDTRDALAALLVRAEDAYFRHLPAGTCGTISLEPLVSDRPGPPVYLTKRLTADQRRAYARDLGSIQAELRKLTQDVPRTTRLHTILRSVHNVGKDLEAVTE